MTASLIEPLFHLNCLSLPGFKWQVHPGGGGQLRHRLWQCVSCSNCAEFIKFSETGQESSQEWNVLSIGFPKSNRRFLKKQKQQIQLLSFLNKYALSARGQEKKERPWDNKLLKFRIHYTCNTASCSFCFLQHQYSHQLPPASRIEEK